MKTLLTAFCFFISITAFSQNITHTIGTSGTFSIKNGSTNFLTLRQSDGQMNILKTLKLENTTSSNVGVIFQDTASFLHTFGDYNTFLGTIAGNFLMTGHHNTGLGYATLYSNTTGDHNVALGHRSLFNNISGNENACLGVLSLYNNINGIENTAVGNNSLYSNTSGLYNTALGYYSLTENTFGSKSTAIGHKSLSFSTSGSENTALGYSTGTIVTTGDNLTLLGYNAEPTSATVNNQITLGNNAITSLRCNVTTITSLSDSRDKKNITDLSLGIDFIMKIKPRIFNWDKREWYENNLSDGSKVKETPTAGFIAQELDEIQTTENAEWLNLVLKDNPEKIEATYGNLLPVIVKAIQDLKNENDALKQSNEKLSAEVEAFKSMNEKLISLEKMMNGMNSIKHTSLNELESISTGGEAK